MNKKTIDYKTRGRKNRERGARFERKVRADLESKGWIIDRWGNNVSEVFEQDIGEYVRKLEPAKRKYNPFKKVMVIGTGFPDFVAFRKWADANDRLREVIGVECKSTGYLSKEEKEKSQWLLDKEVFSKILIASKGQKRGSIIYKEFTEDKK